MSSASLIFSSSNEYLVGSVMSSTAGVGSSATEVTSSASVAGTLSANKPAPIFWTKKEPSLDVERRNESSLVTAAPVTEPYMPSWTAPTQYDLPLEGATRTVPSSNACTLSLPLTLARVTVRADCLVLVPRIGSLAPNWHSQILPAASPPSASSKLPPENGTYPMCFTGYTAILSASSSSFWSCSASSAITRFCSMIAAFSAASAASRSSPTGGYFDSTMDMAVGRGRLNV
mmetsp:Transcript_2924/g.12613  ORF Transcript_2924/g.12613 Transcript_2924/m.12613 type:complete len:231 (-) Transcript_2924:1113-1805(-)